MGVGLILCTAATAADNTAPLEPAPRPADFGDTVSDLMKSGTVVEVTVNPSTDPQHFEIPVGPANDKAELQEIRKTLTQLQETLDFLVNRVMADMEAENIQLRQEVQRLHGRLGTEGMADRLSVPRPNRDLIEQVLSEGAQVPESRDDPAPQRKPAPVAVGPFSMNVVEEWGRSPEAAAELGPGTTSVKGLVCVVPPGSSQEDLTKLGLELRGQYASYDNLNIDVFDDEEAARNYADRHITDPARRVLSISKHKETGRDVILLLDGGIATEVPH
jgi:hypothetical protein